jgi:hypothetical protein
LKRRVTLAQIEERIQLYGKFFQEWGTPVPSQAT